jgi:inosose dehydratase
MQYDKIAGAPISWGVCEVPGWGHQMGPERVLREMASLGLKATEFGPLGFLPVEAEARAKVLSDLDMHATGGFFPVLLHEASHDPIPNVRAELESYVATGATTLVLAADSGKVGYDEKRPDLSAEQWSTVFKNLNSISALAASVGVKAVLHPHVGTIIETHDDVVRVVEGSEISFCLDTGHMVIGGADPVAFSVNHSDRVAHSHLKDVDLTWAKKVQSGEVTYYDAVVQGMYRPLGKGDVDIRAIVRNLLLAGYQGWFVLEQDNVISSEPLEGSGPYEDAKTSVEFLRAVIAEL